MKAVLLCRVSGREQEETGYSLPAQEKLLRGYAQKQGYTIVKIFSISESASGKKQREIFNTMFAYVKKNNIKVIIIEKADRFTRNFKDSVDMYEWLEEDEERQLHSVKDSLILHKNSRSQEKLNWDIRVVFAKNYIDNLSEEVKKGQKEKLAQGWLPCRPKPGYKTVGERGHKTHVPDEAAAPVMRRHLELYATGEYSVQKLSNLIFEAGLRSSTGKRIYKSRIHQLLKDPFYIGKIYWGGQIYQGQHEPLISQEIFDKIQLVLAGKNTPKINRHMFLLKQLLKCAECKGTVTWEIHKGIIYGHCNHYRNCSQKKWTREDEVENQLIKGFEGLQIKNTRIAKWLKKALKESHRDAIDYETSSLKELQDRLAQIEKRLDRLYDDKLDEKITKLFYDQKFRQYTQEKADIVAAIEKHAKAKNNHFDLGVNLYELSQRAKEIYLRAKECHLLEEQRRLISLVFTNMTLDKGNLAYEYSTAFKLIHNAVVETNGSKVANLAENGAKIFEPAKLPDNLSQKASVRPSRPTWLGD
jgi:site-specific DNA recombinase